MSLRRRITLFVTSVLLILLACVFLLVRYQVSVLQEEGLDRRMKTIGHSVGTMVLPGLIMTGGNFETQFGTVLKVLEREVMDQGDVARITVRNKYDVEIMSVPPGKLDLSEDMMLERKVPIELAGHKTSFGDVIVTFNLTQYYGEQSDLFWRFVLVGGLLAAMGVAASLYVSQSVAAPILALRDGALAFGEERYETRVEIDSKDEIGELARTFNVMASRIDKQVHRLSQLQLYSRQIAGELEREFVLVQAINAFERVANISKMSIMLLNEEKGELEIVKGIGLAERATDVVKLKAGEGVAGRVIESGKSIFIEDISTSPYYQSHSGQSKKGEQLFTLPLVAKKRSGEAVVTRHPFGVINVHSKSDGDKFDSADRAILTTLTEIVAVALDNSKLYDDAITDGLTRLHIVRYFHFMLANEIKRTKRTAHPLSLIMADIDKFKGINDTYGHPTGDAVLIGVAQIMRDVFREIDILCRYGGEEFGLILPNTDMDAAFLVGERFRKRIESHEFATPSGPLRLTISCGIAMYKMGMTANEFIHQADFALYKAKREGRNRSVQAP